MTLIIETALVIQSKTTGRFLLIKNQEEEWTFAQYAEADSWSPLSEMLDRTEDLMGQRPDQFTYVISNRSTLHLYHTWVDGEPPARGVDYEWASLFNFPTRLHKSVDWAVESRHFLEEILSPR